MEANAFINQYEVIRTLMHGILRFGTLTPEQLGISPSKYNKMKPLLEAALQGNIEDRRYQKGEPRSLHITADTFSEGLTALSNTYTVKSVKVSELCIRLMILQLLQENDSVTAQELAEEVGGQFLEVVDSRTILRQCQHLAEYGQIFAGFRENKIFYSAADSLLADVPAKTFDRLIEAVSFLRLYYAPTVCGEQLYRSLCDLDGHDSAAPHYLVTGINIGYVLDDAVLYDLLTAIENRQIVSFAYIDQNREHPDFSRILPLKIHSSEPLGRRYLAALDLKDSDKLILCRLDFIKKVCVSREQADIPEEKIQAILEKAFQYSVSSAHLPNEQPTAVQMQYVPEFEPVLRKQFPQTAEYSIENSRNIVSVKVNHPLELKAFLREHAQDIQVLPDSSHTLYEDMQREAKLWRARYGIES